MRNKLSLKYFWKLPNKHLGLIIISYPISMIIIFTILIHSYYKYILFHLTSKNAFIYICIINFTLLLLCLTVFACLFHFLIRKQKTYIDELSQHNQLLQARIDTYHIIDNDLQKAKEKAESDNMAKSRYIVGMAHELRTPLNAILGYIQLLEQDNTNRQKGIRVIRRSSEHLSSLIDGLLDISRIETGRLQLQLGEVRFIEFLDQIVDLFRLQAESKGLNFHFKRSVFLPEIVRADEKRLRQVLINLLSNAIKYTEKGGVEFEIFWKNGVAQLEIRDTGIGMDSDSLELIFEPFERADATNSLTSGLGLGLTISRLLVNMMGGDISVKSQLNIGSTFTLKLLLSSVTSPNRSYDKPRPVIKGYHGKKQTILVVDDDETQCDLLRALLTPLGFIVLTCELGAEALLLTKDIQVNLFILDIQLPHMSGWELAHKLRDAQQPAPIIMLSANIGDIASQAYQPAVHNATLAKPFTFISLLHIIEQCLPLNWFYKDLDEIAPDGVANIRISDNDLTMLRQLAKVGYIEGIEKHITLMIKDNSHDKQLVEWLTKLKTKASHFDFLGYLVMLDTIKNDI